MSPSAPQAMVSNLKLVGFARIKRTTCTGPAVAASDQPLLDLVNCAEGPDPTRVHSTWLDEETQSYAVTKGAWNFKKGEQLFEPYGQPNHVFTVFTVFTTTKITIVAISIHRIVLIRCLFWSND